MSCGVKVTLAVQVAPAANVDPQVLVSEKLDTREPVIEILMMFTVPVPTFFRVTVWGWLEVPRV